MSSAEITEQITAFIRERFLGGDPQGELGERTPLLEWGVLNSLNTAELLSFIRDQLGTTVPPQAVNAQNFKDITNIAALVHSQAQVANG